MNTPAPTGRPAGRSMTSRRAGFVASLRGSQGALRSCQLSAPNNRGQEPQ